VADIKSGQTNLSRTHAAETLRGSFLLNTLCFILYFAKYSLSLHDNLVRKKKNENSESISDDDGPVAAGDRHQRTKD